jgi:hypothetical protein
MRTEARTASARYNKNNRPSTRLDTKDNNYIGDLAHIAVETYLNRLGIPYLSTRLEQYDETHGDAMDLELLGHRIDIKGTKLPEDHFFIYAKNIHNPSKLITHYLFVQINRDETQAHLYGFISKSDFMVKSRFFPKGTGYHFNHDNYGIMLWNLPDFKTWVVSQPELVEAGLKMGA